MKKRCYVVGNDNVPDEKRQIFYTMYDAVRWCVEIVETADKKTDDVAIHDYYIKPYLIEF